MCIIFECVYTSSYGHSKVWSWWVYSMSPKCLAPCSMEREGHCQLRSKHGIERRNLVRDAGMTECGVACRIKRMISAAFLQTLVG